MLMQRVAILGLGIMGGGMAANWLAKGFEVSVWNRTRAKAEPLAAKGAKIAATPREAATGADFIFAMVADDDASRSVWLGPDGALAGAKTGAIGVESSTLTPGWIHELSGQAKAKGVGFLDAPVGGSRPAATNGELRFFVGGDPQTYEAARPALAAVAAGQIAALAEALAVAKKAGFKDEVISELILGGAPASPIVKLKLPRMLAQDFEPTDFALNLMLKDARYATALAHSLGLPAGMIEGAVKAFARADAKGLGDKDIAAVIG
jgi:3-hydroxyisobutyrate dehydrogenase